MDDVTHLSTIESLSKNVTTLDLRVEDERNVEDNTSDNMLCSSNHLLNVDVYFILGFLGGRLNMNV